MILNLVLVTVLGIAGCTKGQALTGPRDGGDTDLSSGGGGGGGGGGGTGDLGGIGGIDLGADLGGLPPMILPAFIVGYNTAWFGDHYSTDLTADFDLAYVNKTLDGIVNAGGHVVRLWLFEFAEGIVWNMSGSPPQTQGISQSFLGNLDKVLTAARARGLWVYLTALNSGDSYSDPPAYQAYFKNMYLNVGGELDAYETKVLAPTLAVIDAHQDNIYGLDLINEIEDAIQKSIFPDPFNAPRAFLKHTRDFIRTKSPWLKVTATAGFGNPAPDISGGFFSGIGLDFYDLHEYSDSGQYSGATALCNRVQQDGVFVILGEFGQSTKAIDDNIQQSSTSGFLSNAKGLCFKGALAWRYDYSALASSNWFNFVRADGSFRPAVSVMKSY